MEILPRSAWTAEPNGWASTTDYGGPLDPAAVETLYVHYPADGVGVRHARLDWAGTKRLLNAYRDWHMGDPNTDPPKGRGWADIGYPFAATQAGQIVELAGTRYVSAHTGGQNHKALAVLLILGDDEEPSDAMVAAVHRLREHLHDGQFPHLSDVLPHRAAPGATTQCPGDVVTGLIQAQAFGPSTYTGGTGMAGMVSPIEGRVTAEYMGYPGHAGIDIAPPKAGTTGVPVYAPFDMYAHNVVRWSTQGNKKSTMAPARSGNGFLGETRGDGMGYVFNHMLPEAWIKEGSFIRQGTLIGRLDRSGNQTGPHLHLERWKSWRDPNSHTNPRIDFKFFGVAPGSRPVTASSGRAEPQDWVKTAQGHLIATRFYTGAHDGRLGDLTVTAIKAFQRAYDLYEDGIWGSKTDAQMAEVLALRDPALYVDGLEGWKTVVAEQWALQATGHYDGWVDGDRGRMLDEAWQRYLSDCGYDAGPADGDYGKRSVKAEQTWLKETVGTYPFGIDGVRGKDTVKALQEALNEHAVKLHVYRRPTAPAPAPTPPPAPKPAPTPPPTPEDQVIEDLDPTDYPTLQDFAQAVADELGRRLSRKD